MLIEPTSLHGVLRLSPKRFGDARGFFSETWNKRTFADAGLDLDFVQDNHSLSAQVGTVRGLHFQAPPDAQGKLVRCGRGAIFDVTVDIRKSSPTYGHWLGEELSFENGVMLWVPPGFAHGFMTRQPDSEIIYKCTNYYAPASDGGVRWDSCGIDWNWDGDVITSDKDRDAPALADFDSPFIFED